MNTRLKWYEVPCDCQVSTSGVRGMHHDRECALIIALREEREQRQWTCPSPGAWQERVDDEVAMCFDRPCECNLQYVRDMTKEKV